MKTPALLARARLLAVALLLGPASARAAATSDVFFTETFDNPASLPSRWSGSTIVTEPRGPGYALKIDNPAVQNTSLTSALPADVKGRRLVVQARVKGANISAKPNPWNGAKLSLLYTLPGDATYYSTNQATLPEGSFDWRSVAVQVNVPAEAVSVRVRVGLENVSGTVWFDELSVEADPAAWIETFDTPADIPVRWSGDSYTTVARGSGQALGVSNSTPGGSAKLSATLPFAALQGGRRLLLTGEVKADNVSAKHNPWNGIKVMLEYTTPDGASYPQAEIDVGTFDWRNVHAVINLPSNVSSAKLVIGLEKVTGSAWFDNLRVTINPVLRGDDFDDGSAASRWSPGAAYSLIPRAGGQALQVASANPNTTTLIASPISPDALRGRLVTLRGLVKGADISAKPNPWNGVKVMLVYTRASGATSYEQIEGIGTGTFDWTAFHRTLLLPDDIVSASLNLGLQNVTGTVAFDDVALRLETGLPYWSNPTPGHKGHGLDAVRGVMVSTNLDQAGIDTLESWGVNVVRWQLGATTYADGLLRPDFNDILAAELAKLDARLPALRAAGIAVVVDLHSLSEGLFASGAAQQRLIDTWRLLAARYRAAGGTVANREVVWAYDIANEPDQAPWKESLLNWNELAERAAFAIRELDPSTTIIVESEHGEPGRFAWLRPVQTARVVYSFHYYHPWTYVAQGIDVQQPYTPVAYPGVIDGTPWDRAQIVADLQEVSDFQARHATGIYVGEFSVLRWAPGGADYLYDVTSIFEEKGWDWSYHAFREWQGWSLEVDAATPRTESTPSPVPTDRLDVLSYLFGGNVPFVR